jgi:hypothetical protein
MIMTEFKMHNAHAFARVTDRKLRGSKTGEIFLLMLVENCEKRLQFLTEPKVERSFSLSGM